MIMNTAFFSSFSLHPRVEIVESGIYDVFYAVCDRPAQNNEQEMDAWEENTKKKFNGKKKLRKKVMRAFHWRFIEETASKWVSKLLTRNAHTARISESL